MMVNVSFDKSILGDAPVKNPIFDPEIEYNRDGGSPASEGDLPNTNREKPKLTPDLRIEIYQLLIRK